MKKNSFMPHVIIWLAIIVVGVFCLTTLTSTKHVSLNVIPMAPQEDEPIIASFKINNPTAATDTVNYRFYANGELLLSGAADLPAGSGRTYRYAYPNTLQMGEQVNFVVKTSSASGEYEAVSSIPTYPPQVWSSFVSFASFSTTLMGFMTTMVYYEDAFGSPIVLNIGLVCSLVLVVLLIFMELSQAAVLGKRTLAIGRLRIKMITLTTVLVIICLGMIATKVAIALAI